MFKKALLSINSLFSKIPSSLKLLNISPPTTKKQIKSKYMELAKRLHPDLKNNKNKNNT